MAAPSLPLRAARGVTLLVAAFSLAACTSGGDAEQGAPEPTSAPTSVASPSAAPTATPLPTPTPTPAPVLAVEAIAGSGLAELHLDVAVPWATTGVSVDGVLRAVSPVGPDETLAATVWIPGSASEVCVGEVADGTRPVFWDAGTEPTPPPAPEPADDIAEPATPEPEGATEAPTATPPPTPTPLPTPTPVPTPTPAPPEPRFCTTATGSVDTPPTLFPGHRVIAHYGTAITPALGVLGEGSPEVALERLVEAAAGYDEFELPVVPAFEFIVSVAQGSPGADGLYTLTRPADEVTPYLEGARSVGGVVFLDLQPGQATFLSQAEQYTALLREPDVHLALDPEWSMRPGEVPGRVFGDTDAATVNEITTWLQDLVTRHGLPQKTLIVHQFLAGMVNDRDLIEDPEGIAVMFHIDGQGPVGAKYGTYDQLSVDPPFFNGFKVFFDEDSRVMTPAEVMAIDPIPVYVSYQ